MRFLFLLLLAGCASTEDCPDHEILNCSAQGPVTSHEEAQALEWTCRCISRDSINY